MHMRNILSVLLLFNLVGLNGCAANNISGLSTWAGRATLIGGDGMAVPGKTLFNVSYGDGEIVFDSTPLGALSGKFITQTDRITSSSFGVASAFSSNAAITVPAISATNTTRGSRAGKAYFSTNGKIFMLCNIEVSFVTTGMMDYEMLGSGVCADQSDKNYSIMFERSGAR